MGEEEFFSLSFKDTTRVSPSLQNICSNILSDVENICLNCPALEYLYLTGLKNNGQTSPIDIIVFSSVLGSMLRYILHCKYNNNLED